MVLIYFRINEMMENGLAQYWYKQYVAPKKELCRYEKNRQPSAAKSRLSLTNLFGAFIILFTGYSLALLVFLIEHIARRVRVGNVM